ncbi:hypothetical protein ROZALSC1DRAFT_30077, partial [Rozella allomycis CSF55]
MRFKSAVIGAGPTGICAVGHLLDLKLHPILWIDPCFNSGRLSSYQNVPSNTKVKLFIEFALNCNTFKEIASQNDDVLNALLATDQDSGCYYDKRYKTIKTDKGNVRSMNLSENWCIEIEGSGQKYYCDSAILATGSHPRESRQSPSETHHEITSIHLDVALDPERLGQIITEDDTVAVVGSSHSAILVLKNLSQTTSCKSILNFYREELKFAEYKDGWILYDNTGLKGQAATWARNELSKVQKIKRIKLPKEKNKEKEVYLAHLRGCTKIVYAIGFERNPLPIISVNDRVCREISYNPKNGQISDENGPLDNCFGFGIAFPEKTIDPMGNVEYAVGLFR